MSDDATARLGLPYLAAGQMQKHVTLNESLTRLDTLVQTTVKSRTRTDQPGDAADGDLYILPAGATGAAWAGKPEGALMRFEAGGWRAAAAPDGLVALVLDVGEVWLRDGGWVRLGERLGAIQTLARLGLNAAADAANPFLAKLNAALWTALETGSGGDGDLRVAFNKQAAGDSLSLLFQSGYGARAELGLLGDDDLRLKVSADGSDWRQALRLDRTTGRAWFDQGATRRETTVLHADGDYAVPGWARSIRVVAVGGGAGGGAGAFGASGLRHGGGGGGGAGGVALADWPAELVAGGLTVAVGAGGLGGLAGAGEDGGDTTIHCGASPILTAQGGGGGGLGDAAAGAHGNRGGRALSASAAEDGHSLDRPDGGGGGGGGGTLDASGVARAGGAGGLGGAHACPAPGGAAGAGWSGGGGWSAPWPQIGFAGGGGGGSAHAGDDGYAGGDAGSAGAGGGGGGAGVTSGGPGGDGAPGVVWITAIG